MSGPPVRTLPIGSCLLVMGGQLSAIGARCQMVGARVQLRITASIIRIGRWLSRSSSQVVWFLCRPVRPRGARPQHARFSPPRLRDSRLFGHDRVAGSRPWFLLVPPIAHEDFGDQRIHASGLGGDTEYLGYRWTSTLGNACFNLATPESVTFVFLRSSSESRVSAVRWTSPASVT